MHKSGWPPLLRATIKTFRMAMSSLRVVLMLFWRPIAPRGARNCRNEHLAWRQHWSADRAFCLSRLRLRYAAARRLYRTLTGQGFGQRGITAALFGDALTDNHPLFTTISSYLK
jgi:hypothetical protein